MAKISPPTLLTMNTLSFARFRIFLCSLILLTLSNSINAQCCGAYSAYGVDIVGDGIYGIDISSGETTFIVSEQNPPANFANGGELIGCTYYAGAARELYSLDLETGTYSLEFNLSSDCLGNSNIVAIEVDPTSGVLYVLSNGGSSPGLHTVDLDNNTCSRVGDIPNSLIAVGLAINDDGAAYIISIGEGTGTADEIYPIDLSDASLSAAISITGAFDDLIFAQDYEFLNNDAGADVLYGYAYRNNEAVWVSIDPITGILTEIGTPINGAQFSSIAICGPDNTSPIPSMGQWALMVLALLLMSLGVITVRRKSLAMA